MHAFWADREQRVLFHIPGVSNIQIDRNGQKSKLAKNRQNIYSPSDAQHILKTWSKNLNYNSNY